MLESLPGDLFQPGDLLNNTYRIEGLLGRGGTSDVYKARSEISGNLVALKVLKREYAADEDFHVLMAREENIREIRHDAVVRYSENHRTPDGHIYLLMDFIDGPGLDKKLHQGPMAAEDLMVICRRVAQGLEAAHARNIVHRDLSPDNIILRSGDPAEAVIIDFGIAKDTNPGAQTIVGNEFAGKYSYAAPEQLSGQTDARSDIYSLGALILANFRGAAPKLGNNPMEVVENKQRPLDLSDVPEPLKSLLDLRKCPLHLRPNLAQDCRLPPFWRFWPLAAAVAAAFFTGALDGLIGTSLPTADPFTLVVQKSENGSVSALGHMPNEESQAQLVSQVDEPNVTLASGDIANSWADDVLTVLSAVDPLPSWQLNLDGNIGSLRASTSDAAQAAMIEQVFGGKLPGSLSGPVEVTFTLPMLTEHSVAEILTTHADCGPLQVASPQTTVGYAPAEPVQVTGRVADTATRVTMFDALRTVADGRRVILDVEVLNPALCVVEQYLPKAPAGQTKVAFHMGGDGSLNPSGRYYVGENPVIDVVLPADMTDGYLTVSILDVSGNVFHLLPNIRPPRQCHSDLRDGQTGPVPVRVAYDLAQAANNGGIAFKVDDSTLGKSKILVLHSNAPLFEGMRPTTESATGFAQALQDSAQTDDGRITSLDSSILITAKP
ncbi:putative serine/threonine-protein kinase Sps1 [Nymphon striatum]|nr:putative serine/threonine-protein kinase Sps1 [Nymphon striatum]